MIWTTTYLTSVGWFVMKFAFTSIHGPQRMKPTGTCSVFFCKATVTLTLNEILKNLIQTVYSWCPEDEPYCLWQFSSRAKFALIQWTGKSPNFSWIMAFWIDIHDPLRMNFHTFVDWGNTSVRCSVTVVQTEISQLLESSTDSHCHQRMNWTVNNSHNCPLASPHCWYF